VNAGHVKKLMIKSGMRLLVMNAPQEYTDEVEGLPETASLTVWQPETGPFPVEGGEFDFVQCFVRSVAELASLAPVAIKAVKRDGLLWICYPKKSGKIKTDITRDVGWDVVYNAGFEGVSLISIDETWSSMRFRPYDEAPRARPSLQTGDKKQEKRDKPKEIAVPDDLQQALRQSPAALAFLESLAFSHKREYVNWITEAKKAETRASRIEKTIEKLANGKKRPSDK
jgi:hypothetical protein